MVILLQGGNGIDLDKPDNDYGTLSSLLLSRDAEEQRSYYELGVINCRLSLHASVFLLYTFPILSFVCLLVSFVTFIKLRGGKRYLDGI